MRRCKLLSATVGATVLLGVLAAGASAGNLSTTSQTFRATFASVEITHGGSIRCAVTLEGSLHARTVPKMVGTLIGYITRADLGACAQGRATILRGTLPWHVRYRAFSGRLPAIMTVGVNIVSFSMAVAEGMISCLYRSTAENPVTGTFFRNTAGGHLTTMELLGVVPTECGILATVQAAGAPVTVLNSTTRITVTLI